MTARTAFVALVFLAGCSSSPQPGPGATSASSPGATAYSRPPSDAAAPARYRTSSRPSDWALSVVGTPFVFAFRAVVCATSAVVAGPTAALFAVSDDPRGGFAYLRSGLAQNCGPPYAVPLPSAADRAREPAARYSYAPDLGQPRRLTPYTYADGMAP
ncbi:MAG: hypothetical protein ACREIR_20075 [Geminicoccaceae bacterium]